MFDFKTVYTGYVAKSEFDSIKNVKLIHLLLLQCRCLFITMFFVLIYFHLISGRMVYGVCIRMSFVGIISFIL